MAAKPIILLVDDERAILALLSHELEAQGYQVIKAQSTSEALQRAKDFTRIDLLATDVVLPGALKIAKHYLNTPPKHGIELMRKLLVERPGLRVLLFSGQSDEILSRVGGIPQGTVFLRKPLTPESFARAVREVLAVPAIKAGPAKRTLSSWVRSIRHRLFRTQGRTNSKT